MKPDFDSISKAELRAYVVAHRNDQEAFYKFVDRFKVNPSDPKWHPFPKTPEDWAKVSDLIEEQIKKLEK